MNTYYIGIDPGKAGAFAIIDEDLNVHEMDLFDSHVHFKQVIKNFGHAQYFATIEKLGAMPVRGSIGNWKLGENYGQWKGVLEGLEIPYQHITPQKWQKAILDTRPVGRDKVKKAIKEFSERRFPGIIFPRKKDWDKADALCLALYGLRSEKGTL